jgi:pyrimidine-nucleoside phosphorylase
LVAAEASGVLEAVDSFALGELGVAIGGGRRAKEDEVDPRVGILVKRRVGEPVKAGDVLAELHLAKDEPAAVARCRTCFRIGAGPVTAPELILERIE